MAKSDDQVFIPYSTAMKRVFGADYLSSISVQANNDKLIAAAETELTELIRKQHEIPVNKEPDFHIRNQAEFMETLEESSQTFTNMILESLSFLSSWRHRHYEHYARFGDGTDERDWATQSRWCAAHRYPGAVPR